MKKNSKNTKQKIVSAAWKLFYSQGFEDTTIEDIVEASETSKGSFYHYFSGKEDLLGTLSILFDEKYEELMETMDPSLSPVEKLIFMNQELFLMIENSVSIDLLSRLLAAQLLSKGDRYLLNTNRTYYKLLRQIVVEGQEQKIFRDNLTANDIIKSYAMLERGLMYDWCTCNGDYSLCSYSASVLPALLQAFMK